MWPPPPSGAPLGAGVVVARAAAGSPEGRRPRSLTRTEILDTAIALVDQEGLDQLTMRRLGSACGVEAMALYRHVHGRQDLLGGIVDHLVEKLRRPARGPEARGWLAGLSRPAGARRTGNSYRSFASVSDIGYSAAGGFDDRTAVSAYRAYTTFLLGQLLLEVSARGASLSPVEDELPGRTLRSLSNYQTCSGCSKSSARITARPNSKRRSSHCSIAWWATHCASAAR
ncbi:hypothetical protein HNP40_000993 [Mycobacteroides chelonae]|nr:hypothetical protein [Mycobacteroides chelonae]